MHYHEAVLSQDKGVGIGIGRPRHLIAASSRQLTLAQAVQGASHAVYGPTENTGSTLQLVCTAMHGQDKNPSRGQGSLHKYGSLYEELEQAPNLLRPHLALCCKELLL